MQWLTNMNLVLATGWSAIGVDKFLIDNTSSN